MKFEDKVKILREKKHKGRETKEFCNDVISMAQGEAFEYLMGQVMFCGITVDLTYKPMIPRPETEFWVKEALKQLDVDKKLKILDLFCGSGCVGLAALKALQGAQLTFSDIVSTTKEQIDISCEKNKFEESRYEVIVDDCEHLFSIMSPHQYDVIFAVPPYVPKSMHDEVMVELSAEQPVFFFDKEEGLYYITKVLQVAENILVPGGVLYMEFDITQRDQIEALLTKQVNSKYSFFQDPYGHDCAIKLHFNYR